MNKLFLSFFFLLTTVGKLSAQETLPDITVTDQNGIIIVSWKNEYPLPVKNINIQRSYDSLKNYSTIGSVLNPQNHENGFADTKPPYNKMYYRVFISFDGGAYQFSEPTRPVKDPVMFKQVRDSLFVGIDTTGSTKNPKLIPRPNIPDINNNTPLIIYPSRRIFTGKDNNVVITLTDASTNKYQVKFFDENNVPLFEINRLPENYLIIEKVNFIHSGWYFFELYENGKLLEKNKFFVPKDGKQVAAKGEQGKS
jgi:hypothetical protein